MELIGKRRSIKSIKRRCRSCIYFNMMYNDRKSSSCLAIWVESRDHNLALLRILVAAVITLEGMQLHRQRELEQVIQIQRDAKPLRPLKLNRPTVLGLMDNNNGSPPQGGEPAMDAGDWRCQLQVDSRQRIVIKIMDTLKRHLPYSSEDELKKIAVRFEEKIYVAAPSQSDYLSKISLKMLSMETKSQNTMANCLQSNSAGSSGMQPQVTSQGQLLSENIQSNVPPAGVQNSAGLSSALPPTSGPQQQILPPQQQLIASLDSTVQTGNTNGADWQEEGYQKIKVMKEMYYPELSEMYQKLATKLHQHNSLPQQPKSDQLEKLKLFKTMLERMITVLQISKSNISPSLKEKLGLYEKQIINFINTNRPRKPVSSLQPEQLPPPHMQSMKQSQSQITQVQSHENQMNPQLQSLNLQGSVPTMQQNNMTGLQQNSMSSLSGVSTAQQNMMNPLQPSSNMDPGQGTALNSLQQVPVGSIQQTPVSAPQQANMNALSSQNWIKMLQSNINPLQSNSGMLHSQHLKQQEQQLYQNQLKQQYQQRQMQQQQLMQKQQIFQQQQQQQELQQLLPGQLEPQLHQISVVNDMNMNHLSSSKSGSNMLQESTDSLKSNSGMLDNQRQKQETSSVNLKQLYQQLQMQQQWMQKLQMLQEKQQQQIQQLQQQAKQRLHFIYFICLIFLIILYVAAVFGKGYWI